MRLTPLDIRKQEFKKAMRGLETDEVHAFLATVADEYEAVLNDNKALRERLIELDDKVAEYRNMEKTLRDTLLTAERVTVEAKDNAQREANLIIKEAQIEAEKSVRDIKQDAMNLRHEIQNLKRQRDSYLARMKMLVESHLKFLETAEADFVSEEKQLESEIKRWSDRGKRAAQNQAAETKPTDPASASMRSTGSTQPAATPTPSVTPPTPPMSTPAERGEIPPSTASTPATTQHPNVSAPPRAGGTRDQARSVSVQGQSGLSREQEIHRLLDRMTNEHESSLEQTPGGARVATLTETAAEEAAAATAVEKATTATAAEKATTAVDGTPVASDEEPNKWSMERLRQDILSHSPGSDEKN